MTTAGNQSRENIEQAIQSDWKKIGVAAPIDNQPARVMFGDTMRQRKFEGGVMYAWMSAPQSIPKTTLYSTMVPEKGNNWAGQNYTGYKNPKVDKIIDDLDVSCGPEQQKALWHELQSTYAEELPALPLYYRADSFFIPRWLKGVVPTGHLNPSTLWIEDWSAP
jgi:peptide/nickel transport system substrate-binding protein